MLSRSSKKSQVQQLKDNFAKSKASFIVNCIGLNVEEMTVLRKNLKQNQGNIQVIRNTLSVRAMEDHETLKQTYSSFMAGCNAFVLAFDDPVKVAKIIDTLEQDSEVFKVKAGVLEGQALDKSEVKTLAQLPSQEILQAQFLSLLSTPMTRFLLTIKEAPQAFTRLLVSKKSTDEKK